MEEIYRDVKDYEGLYMVSNTGKVKSLPRATTSGKVLKTSLILGYVCCGLWREGKGKMVKVHRLIATAFIPNPNNYPHINHINGVKEDNSIENLEWVTPKENTTHRDKLKKNKRSKYHGVCSQTYKDKTYWTANIRIKGETTHLGSFKTEEEAYEAKTKKMKEYGIINKYA